jgi:hypothetical protein
MAAKKDNWALGMSIAAFAVSLIALFFSFRTYFLSERPYIGITRVEETLERAQASSPDRLRWAITLKNTGSLPAAAKVSQRKITVAHGTEVFDVPLNTVPDASIFLMPGAEGTLYGDVPDNKHVPLVLIAAGKATITDVLRIAYQPSKAVLWRSQYVYEAKLHYVGGPGPKYFTFTVVDAD